MPDILKSFSQGHQSPLRHPGLKNIQLAHAWQSNFLCPTQTSAGRSSVFFAVFNRFLSHNLPLAPSSGLPNKKRKATVRMDAPVSRLAMIHDIIRRAKFPNPTRLLTIILRVASRYLRDELKLFVGAVGPDAVILSLASFLRGVAMSRFRSPED